SNNVRYAQRLHALSVTTGQEMPGSPVLIQASLPGSGDGGSNGAIPFDALTQNQRCALALANGVVYIAWASHGDVDPYHGWIIGYRYNAQTHQLTQAAAWMDT